MLNTEISLLSKFHREKRLTKRQYNKQYFIKVFRQGLIKFLTFLLLLGFAYIILYPFLFKILSSFMSENDLYNVLVELIPMEWTLERYTDIILYSDYLKNLGSTFLYSLLVGVGATFAAAFVGYGLAKFKFPGVRITIALVIISMMLPIASLSIPLYARFRFFDIFGIIEALGGIPLNFTDTPLPMLLLSFTGLSFRAGIFIILLRQYYIGVPNELIEAAYVDGSSVMSTYFRIILPMARSMLVVVFALAFAWEWTDTFYYSILNSTTGTLSQLVLSLNSMTISGEQREYTSAINQNAGAILAIVPLLIFYSILQKQIIQGIERSGIVG